MKSERSNSSSFVDRGGHPARRHARAVRFSLHAITSMPNARPTVRHHRAEAAQADDPEGGAGEIGAHGALPATLVDVAILGRDLSRQREQEAPRQLRRRREDPTGAGDRDPELRAPRPCR